ncbi:MAG: hypothetical protein WA191_02260 [Telluria sp.]
MKLHIISVAMLLASGTLIAGPVQAAPELPADAAPGEQTVEVSGVRDPQWKPYRTLLLGFDAFDSNRVLAPAAALRFSLRPLNPSTSMDGINLLIAGSTQSTPVPLDPNNSFSLPRNQAAADDGAELLINRKKNTMTIRPDIRTPGLAANVRRLGDLRLECHVRWAIEKDELSFLKRNAFRMVGGPCNSGKVKTFYIADRPVSAVWLAFDGRKVPLEIAGRGALFRPPLHDSDWSDDALVVLEFADVASVQGTGRPFAAEHRER